MGTGFHLATEQFVFSAGMLKALHVPYKGESPLLTDLIGGQVDFAFSSTAQADGRPGQAGRAGLHRRQALAGHAQPAHGARAGHPAREFGWQGFAVPAGVPAARDNDRAALQAAANDPEVVAHFSKVAARCATWPATPSPRV